LVTSQSLTSQLTYALTLLNSAIITTSVLVGMAYTDGGTTVGSVTGYTPSNGSAVINITFSAAYTGTVKLAFVVSN
jgi:hypothetical protein